jgi:p-aminobenzoyl-glutamate transporter AbgT
MANPGRSSPPSTVVGHLISWLLPYGLIFLLATVVTGFVHRPLGPLVMLLGIGHLIWTLRMKLK